MTGNILLNSFKQLTREITKIQKVKREKDKDGPLDLRTILK